MALEQARREVQGIWADADRLAHGSSRRRASPSQPRPDANWAWFAGLGAMAAAGAIEWPIAALLAASHAIQRRSHNQLVDQLAEGVEEGA